MYPPFLLFSLVYIEIGRKSRRNRRSGKVRNFSAIFFCPLLDISVSGSPIIQDGKLVGAVTHVLVNDPTRGYGIFIENMLETAK